VTDELVRELRQTHQLKVVAGIESFTKRSAVRNIQNAAGLDKQELGIIYDKFYNVLYYKKQEIQQQKNNRRQEMDSKSFALFIGSLASWAKIDQHEGDEEQRQLKVAHNFFAQLFMVFDIQRNSSLSLQVSVRGSERKNQGQKRECLILIAAYRT
jgi:hypothetical protein